MAFVESSALYYGDKPTFEHTLKEIALGSSGYETSIGFFYRTRNVFASKC